MLFFRSEEAVRTWCRDQGHPLRPRVPLDQLWTLAHGWYRNRLEPGYQRPAPEKVRQIFARAGLVDDFWNPWSERY